MAKSRSVRSSAAKTGLSAAGARLSQSTSSRSSASPAGNSVSKASSASRLVSGKPSSSVADGVASARDASSRKPKKKSRKKKRVAVSQPAQAKTVPSVEEAAVDSNSEDNDSDLEMEPCLTRITMVTHASAVIVMIKRSSVIIIATTCADTTGH